MHVSRRNVRPPLLVSGPTKATVEIRLCPKSMMEPVMGLRDCESERGRMLSYAPSQPEKYTNRLLQSSLLERKPGAPVLSFLELLGERSPRLA